MLPLLFSLTSLCALTTAADSSIPLVSGNGGLTGAGYGDAYGGKVADGVYGVGGRAGGNLGLTGLLGLGSGRRKRQIVNSFPMASALASVYGAQAVAGAAGGAGPGRLVPFGSLYPMGIPPPPPTTTTTTTPTTKAPTPAHTTPVPDSEEC